MNKVFGLALLCTCLALCGCGSFLASMESNSMEEDPGERTMGQQLEDESIETKAIVNIHAANEAFDDAHLVVVSYNGYVLLAGQVHSEALKAQERGGFPVARSRFGYLGGFRSTMRNRS